MFNFRSDADFLDETQNPPNSCHFIQIELKYRLDEELNTEPIGLGKNILKTIITSSCLLFLSAGIAGATTCYFESEGKIEIQGKCDFHFTENDSGVLDGSFSMTSIDYDSKKQLGHQVWFIIDYDGAPYAFWTGEPGATHLHAPTGYLSKVGGCWVNHDTRLCAWEKTGA
ncbi:hypothetical protein [Falsihalocynthiibacter arcticus]|uniref:Uncharacterized protein n=1 Tax=Falsihalocynthiibacter arcticus TaxID=1579316 RepID=A0A126V2M1_9RHOB|nr:hypothetical protein [Falsihalocynthiibacter arcticus]AML52562.1 hypothetical protein RC74_15950 [Falsihalocynthiibacter arcticus]